MFVLITRFASVWTPDRLTALSDAQVGMARLIFDGIVAHGYAGHVAAGVVANALAESSLDPRAINREASGSQSVGLFQLNDAPTGLGVGMSVAARQDPRRNLAVAMAAMDRYASRFRATATAEDAAEVFTRYVERPRNVDHDVATRRELVSRLFRFDADGVTDRIVVYRYAPGSPRSPGARNRAADGVPSYGLSPNPAPPVPTHSGGGGGGGLLVGAGLLLGLAWLASHN